MYFSILTTTTLDRFLLENEIKRFYPQARIEYRTVVNEAVDLLVRGKIDALFSSKQLELIGGRGTESISFSAYEDYFYDIHYDKKAISVAPLFELLDGTYLPKLNNKDSLALPGRIAKFLEEKYEQIKKHRIYTSPVGRGVQFEDRFRYFIYFSELSRVKNIYAYFIKRVLFIGAGIGSYDYITVRGMELLKYADVCLHDSLIDPKILNLLPEHAKIINVGKRCRKHSAEQVEINKLIVDYARRGLRVIRLKSGDPSIFGRLAEEAEYLSKNSIPFEIVPGISCINAASTSGVVLTKRRLNRGFTAMSPIKHGGEFKNINWEERKKLPIVLFMSVRVVDKVCKNLIDEGLSENTRATMIFNIGHKNEIVIKGNLRSIASKVKLYTRNKDQIPPGLFIVGDIYQINDTPYSDLWRRRILVIGEETERENIGIRLSDVGAKVVYYDFPPLDTSVFGNVSDPNIKKTIIINEQIVYKALSGYIKRFPNGSKNFLILNRDTLNRFDCSLTNLTTEKFYYFFIKEDPSITERFPDIQKVKCSFCTRDRISPKGIEADILLFQKSEFFWYFLELYGDTVLTSKTIWAPRDDKILNYLITKKHTDFLIMPDLSTNTDISFIFTTTQEKNNTNKLILRR